MQTQIQVKGRCNQKVNKYNQFVTYTVRLIMMDRSMTLTVSAIHPLLIFVIQANYKKRNVIMLSLLGF